VLMMVMKSIATPTSWMNEVNCLLRRSRHLFLHIASKSPQRLSSSQAQSGLISPVSALSRSGRRLCGPAPWLAPSAAERSTIASSVAATPLVSCEASPPTHSLPSARLSCCYWAAIRAIHHHSRIHALRRRRDLRCSSLFPARKPAPKTLTAAFRDTTILTL
jgi:hypothetical protein